MIREILYRLRVGPKIPETRNTASDDGDQNDNGKWVYVTYEN